MYVKIKNDDGTFSLVHSDLGGDHLEHYGLPRRSGRYKYGSGKDPYQHSGRRASHLESSSKKRKRQNVLSVTTLLQILGIPEIFKKPNELGRKRTVMERKLLSTPGRLKQSNGVQAELQKRRKR